ncbi:hypothetical protein [Cypionkella sp.]|uniref:hypothetical protein n=1 Tax=Cypionkella sp. TaxID=2811411 RepID=UPI00271FCC61|nr:hypothetical protein [Cypionkella sp.]MDO8985579.1 hypothetical protein [Cypionkella sp.]MDP2048756.1 hypothetical protein [Cypionkella sp.]
MRCVWTALALLALSSPATADECKIVWWDLFLPQSDVEFEKTSDASALLTLKNTGKLEPISFELALRNVTKDDGKGLSLLLGTQTLVAGGVSNQVTVTLQPKTTSWLVGFESEQIVRAKDGQTFGGVVRLTGHLVCNQLKP